MSGWAGPRPPGLDGVQKTIGTLGIKRRHFSLGTVPSDKPTKRLRRTRSGNIAEVDISRIGKRPSAEPKPDQLGSNVVKLSDHVRDRLKGRLPDRLGRRWGRKLVERAYGDVQIRHRDGFGRHLGDAHEVAPPIPIPAGPGTRTIR
jgi:hypothetical protein